MSKNCSICNKKLGWKKFRCVDGVVCADCYKIVSNQYTSKIIDKELWELLEIYNNNLKELNSINLGNDGFFTTKKIGTFLMLDEERKKICIPCNFHITKKFSNVQIIPYKSLKGYKLITEPNISFNELMDFYNNPKKQQIINYMCIRLLLDNSTTQDIVILPKSVRTSSFAFRKGYKIANNILQNLDEIMNDI